MNPGDYKLEIIAPDFNPYTEMVKVTPDMGPLAVTLGSPRSRRTSKSPKRATKSALIPTRALAPRFWTNFIDALPDDEDELANYLSQIAGTRGGAGGATTSLSTDSPADVFHRKIRFRKSASATAPLARNSAALVMVEPKSSPGPEPATIAGR